MPETTLPETGSPTEVERSPGLSRRLKAERIQERLKAERIQEPVRAASVQERLAELPGWRVARGNRALARTYGFPTGRAAAAFVVLAVEIGEAAGYVPELDLRGGEVTLRVDTGDEGLTELDFEVAELFERSL